MSEEVTLSEVEVQRVLDYASEYYKAYSNFNNSALDYYSGYTAHENLINLTNAPLAPSKQRIRDALIKYTESEEVLVAYNQFMETFDAIFNKTIRYYASLLSFNRWQYCNNIVDSDEYKSQEYKDDERRMQKFFENFDVEEEFSKALRMCLINDVYYTWLRNSSGTINDEEDILTVRRNQKYVLQAMPQSYCRITGTGTTGFLYDFDLSYFSSVDVNIENFDPALIKIYSEKTMQDTKPKSIAINPKDYQKGGVYSIDGYARVSPYDGAWAWKFCSDKFNTLPPFSYLMKSTFNHDFIEALQHDKDMIAANALIIGEMKTRNDNTTSNNQDPFLIAPKVVGQLMKLASKGINNNIKHQILPSENNKLFQFQDNNPNMYDKQLNTSAGLGASSNTMIYSSEKMNQFELESALNLDYQFVKKFYKQCEKFLNFYVNKKTRIYKFTFSVTGSNLPFIRKQEIENYMKFSDKGIQVNVAKVASLLDITPNALSAMMQEVAHGDMLDTLRLLLNSNTASDEEADVGRPESNSESANATKDYM